MCGSTFTQIGSCREMRPAHLHNKFFAKHTYIAASFADYTNVLRNTIPGRIEQTVSIRKPAAPTWAKRNTRSQVAGLARFHRQHEYISTSPARVAPLT